MQPNPAGSLKWGPSVYFSLRIPATYTVGALLLLLVGHLSENGYRFLKQPITPVRPVRITINPLDTLQKLTGTLPVTQ